MNFSSKTTIKSMTSSYISYFPYSHNLNECDFHSNIATVSILS